MSTNEEADSNVTVGDKESRKDTKARKRAEEQVRSTVTTRSKTKSLVAEKKVVPEVHDVDFVVRELLNDKGSAKAKGNSK